MAPTSLRATGELRRTSYLRARPPTGRSRRRRRGGVERGGRVAGFSITYARTDTSRRGGRTTSSAEGVRYGAGSACIRASAHRSEPWTAAREARGAREVSAARCRHQHRDGTVRRMKDHLLILSRRSPRASASPCPLWAPRTRAHPARTSTTRRVGTCRRYRRRRRSRGAAATAASEAAKGRGSRARARRARRARRPAAAGGPRRRRTRRPTWSVRAATFFRLLQDTRPAAAAEPQSLGWERSRRFDERGLRDSESAKEAE